MKIITTDKKYAVINQETGIVENVVMWDGVSLWSPGPGFILMEVTGMNPMGSGMKYEKGKFSHQPEAPVKKSVQDYIREKYLADEGVPPDE